MFLSALNRNDYNDNLALFFFQNHLPTAVRLASLFREQSEQRNDSTKPLA